MRVYAVTPGREDWHAEYRVLAGRPSRVYGAIYYKGIRTKSFDVAVKADNTFEINAGSSGTKIRFRCEEDKQDG